MLKYVVFYVKENKKTSIFNSRMFFINNKENDKIILNLINFLYFILYFFISLGGV